MNRWMSGWLLVCAGLGCDPWPSEQRDAATDITNDARSSDSGDVTPPGDAGQDANSDVANSDVANPDADTADGAVPDGPLVDVADANQADLGTGGDVPDAPDTGSPVDVACPAGTTRCALACVDLGTDRANCGACGMACPGSQVCAAGACQPVCASGQTNCNGVCLTLNMPCTVGQGVCTRSGMTVCGMGTTAACSVSPGAPGTESCNRLDDDCDGQVDEDFNFATDNANCGACGVACGSGRACVGGTCQIVCPSGQTNCNGVCLTLGMACTVGRGVCARAGTTVCGASTVPVCPVVEGMAGTETCNGLDDDCDGQTDEDFDLNTSAAHCGACGRACAAGFTCVAGRCGNEAVHVAINHYSDPAHSCAVLRSGEVWCWGANSRGTIVPGVSGPPLLATRLGTFSDAAATALGTLTTCVLHRGMGSQGGDISCFGNNIPWIDPNGSSRRFTGLRATQVVAGHVFVCHLRDDGRVFCLGSNGSGALGTLVNLGASSNDWVEIQNLSGVTSLVAGTDHACAIDGAGAVWCWGACSNAQCGADGTNAARTPVRVSSLPDPVNNPALELSATSASTCARLRNGVVHCWGLLAARNVAGMAVAGVGGIPPLAAIAGGETNTHCGATATGEVYCWGLNNAGLIDAASLGARSWVAPQRVMAAPASVTRLAVGSNAACAIDRGGAVRCWGSNDTMQLGVRREVFRNAPERVMNLSGVTRIATGSLSTCAQTASGIVCWGESDALGTGQPTGGRSVPTPVIGLPADATLAAGAASAHCALSAGQAQCWGRASVIGRGRADNAAVLTPAPALRGAETPLAGIANLGGLDQALCATTVTGQAFCTGLNDYGQLGAASPGFLPFFNEVQGIGGPVASVRSSIFYGCALRTDGRIGCWGWNRFGFFGDGSAGDMTFVNRAPGSLVNNAELGIATQMALGEGSMCATNSNRELYCWGENFSFSLGAPGARATTPRRLTIPNAEPVEQVTAGRSFHCARTSLGNVFCWGSNASGQVGAGQPNDFLPLTRVNLSGVAELSSGARHSCARTTGGEVFCWGDNSRGQIGDGSLLIATTHVRPTNLP